MVTSIYKDLSLAPAGEQKIAWVRAHMPLLRALEARFSKEAFCGQTHCIIYPFRSENRLSCSSFCRWRCESIGDWQ